MKKKAEELNYAREKIIEGFSIACGGYLQAGKYLTIIKMKELFKLDGEHKTFISWVKNELGYSKSVAYNAMDVYDKFGDLIEHHPDFKKIDFSRMVALLPYVKKETSLDVRENLLHMAESQTCEGLRNNLREMSGKAPSDAECDHDFKPMKVCTKCGKWGKE
jgi:hypothetical protein